MIEARRADSAAEVIGRLEGPGDVGVGPEVLRGPAVLAAVVGVEVGRDRHGMGSEIVGEEPDVRQLAPLQREEVAPVPMRVTGTSDFGA